MILAVRRLFFRKSRDFILRSRQEVLLVWAERSRGFLALFCWGFVLAVGELGVRGMENEVEKMVGGRQFWWVPEGAFGWRRV